MSFQQASAPEFKLELGKILERQRKHLNLTASQVAAVCGTHQSVVSRYETGEMTPAANIFLRLMICLRLDLAELKQCLRFDSKGVSA